MLMSDKVLCQTIHNKTNKTTTTLMQWKKNERRENHFNEIVNLI